MKRIVILSAISLALLLGTQKANAQGGWASYPTHFESMDYTFVNNDVALTVVRQRGSGECFIIGGAESIAFAPKAFCEQAFRDAQENPQ